MVKLFSQNEYNIFAQALINISGAKDWNDNEIIYEYIQATPKTSFVVEMVDEIDRLQNLIK